MTAIQTYVKNMIQIRPIFDLFVKMFTTFYVIKAHLYNNMWRKLMIRKTNDSVKNTKNDGSRYTKLLHHPRYGPFGAIKNPHSVHKYFFAVPFGVPKNFFSTPHREPRRIVVIKKNFFLHRVGSLGGSWCRKFFFSTPRKDTRRIV